MKEEPYHDNYATKILQATDAPASAPAPQGAKKTRIPALYDRLLACDGVGKGWGILLFADGSISFGRMIDGHPRPGSEIGFTDCANLKSEIFPEE